MQLNRCPICHHRISLVALAQDEAARALMNILAKLDAETGTALVNYLGLFRSASRDLANDRALNLAKEVLNMGEAAQLGQAMRMTVENLREKSNKPLSNHNYLKKVLDDVVANVNPVSRYTPPKTAGITNGKTSKTAQALQALEEWGND